MLQLGNEKTPDGRVDAKGGRHEFLFRGHRRHGARAKEIAETRTHPTNNGTRMSRNRADQDIFEPLKQAQKATELALEVDGCPTIVALHATDPPVDLRDAWRTMDRCIDEVTWRTDGSAFQRQLDWVEIR